MEGAILFLVCDQLSVRCLLIYQVQESENEVLYNHSEFSVAGTSWNGWYFRGYVFLGRMPELEGAVEKDLLWVRISVAFGSPGKSSLCSDLGCWLQRWKERDTDWEALVTKCKWEKEETKVKHGSSVSDGPEQGAGNVISSHKRKSRFGNKIKPGCVNKTICLASYSLQNPVQLLFQLILLQLRYLGDVHAEMFSSTSSCK